MIILQQNSFFARVAESANLNINNSALLNLIALVLIG